MEVLTRVVVGLDLGFVVGVGRGRSWAIMLAPVAFIANLEQAALSLAPGPLQAERACLRDLPLPATTEKWAAR